MINQSRRNLPMKRLTILPIILLLLYILGSQAYGAVFNVSNPAQFQDALTTAQSNAQDDTINVQADMTITSTLTYLTDDGDGGHSLTINGNGHTLNGGGLYVYTGEANITIEDCSFSGNSADYVGGAYVRLYYDSATADIYNNILWGNTASAGGYDGDDLYVDSDADGNGTGSAVNLYNNDLGPNSDLTTQAHLPLMQVTIVPLHSLIRTSMENQG